MHWKTCNALPHCLGAMGSRTPAMHCLTALGVVGSGTPAWHYHNAGAQSAIELLSCTSSLPGVSQHCHSCNALPLCPGAMGSATRAVYCHTALGKGAVEILQYTASLLGGSGQCNSYNTLPHCLGAVGIGTPVQHCLAASAGQVCCGLLKCWIVYPPMQVN